MEAATKQSNRQEAQRWFLALSNSQVQVAELHIHMLVDVAAREGDFYAAEAWFSRFSADHGDLLTPSVRDALICSAARAGDIERAEALLESSKSGMYPSQSTFAAVALATLEASEDDGVACVNRWFALADSFSLEKDDLFAAMARVAEGAARMGRLEVAEDLLERVLQQIAPGRPYGPEHSACYEVARVLAEKGRLDDAEACVQRGQKLGPEWLRRICPELVRVFASQKQLKRAEKIFLILEKAGIADLKAFCVMVNAAAKCADLVAAERWFEQALDAGVTPDIVLFASLVDAASRKGDMKAAEYWYKRAGTFGLRPSKEMLGTLVNGEARNGNLQAAQRWAALAQQEFGPNLIILNCLVDAHARGKDMTSAEKVLQEDIIQAGLQPDERSFGPVINAYAEQGRFSDALRCFRAMSAQQVRPSVVQYNQLLKACSRSQPRLVREALEVFEELMEACAQHNQGRRARPTGPARGGLRDLEPTRITLKALGRCVGARRLAQICQVGSGPLHRPRRPLNIPLCFPGGAWHRAGRAAGHQVQCRGAEASIFGL